MEQHEKDPQEELRRARVQRFNRGCNRVILMLGFGIVALGVYQYILVPMMN